MAKRTKPHVKATQWLEGSEFYRWENVPRKLTRAELAEMRNKLPYAVFKERVRRVSEARLRYNIETRSLKSKMKFIQDRIKGAPAKFATKGEFEKAYNTARKRAHRKYGYGKGYITDLGWYINVAFQSGMPGDLLERLDALETQLTFAELQQLYMDLPNLKVYYQSGVDKKTGKAITKSDDVQSEWQSELEDVVHKYEDMIGKRESKKGKRK